MCLVGFLVAAFQQVRDPRPIQPFPVPVVASAEDLRAKTVDDKAAARFFDSKGPKLLESGGQMTETAHPAEAPLIADAKNQPDAWQTRVCAADAIMIAHATSQRTLLNIAETGLVTVSELAVDRWIAPKEERTSLALAMRGGQAKVGERLITHELGEGRNLRKPWLLFLKKIPDGDVFRLSGAPVSAGEVLPQSTKAAAKESPWSELEERVKHVQMRCGAAK